MKRRALTLVPGNPAAPVRKRRPPLPLGPIKVVRYPSLSPDLVTLAAVTEDESQIIGMLQLPLDCMDVQDMEWLRKRAERLQQRLSSPFSVR